MKVQFIKSACVLIEHAGTRVLCDPWLTDGVYYGSWYHYPPLKVTPQDFQDVDYIYISHIHPDHLDPNTLRQMPKDIPILVHSYEEKFLVGLLKKIGCENVIEVSHKETFNLAPDFNVEILAADNCDPALCGLYYQCAPPQSTTHTMQIDSMAVFSGGGKTVLNSNDCPYGLAKAVCDYVKKKYSKIDFHLLSYSGAGPYPQCFENLDDHSKFEERKKHRATKLNEMIGYLRQVAPTAFMPFAGQYTLGGKLARLNRFVSPPQVEELPAIIFPLLELNKIESKLILLNSLATYDVDKESISEPFIPPDPADRKRYIDEVLAHKKLDYEDVPEADPKNWVDLTDKLNIAHGKMMSHQKQYGAFKSEWHIYIDAGQGFYYYVPFSEGKQVEKVYPHELVVPYLRIGLDYALLVRILDRKAHWNNAEVGSHLRYFREPNVYDRSIHLFMSYFHT